MKNAVMLHGAGGSPKLFWQPWLRRELKRRGYQVWAPQLPDGKRTNLATRLPFVLEHGRFDRDTVIIGHSAGVPTALAVLERLSVKIKLAILVAGFSTPLGSVEVDGILQKRYDWKKIHGQVGDVVFIHSDNDPWGCDDRQGRRMFDRLGGTFIICHGEGHFGSTRFHQTYKTFPLLLRFLD